MLHQQSNLHYHYNDRDELLNYHHEYVFFVCVLPSLSLSLSLCVETSAACQYMPGIVLPLGTTLWLTEPIEPLVLQNVVCLLQWKWSSVIAFVLL